MPPSILVVGEALVDVTQAPDRPDAEHPGGSPLNVAVGLARLGLPTTLASQVGDDAYGKRIRDHLADSGVHLLPLPPNGPTASATARLDTDGHATYEFDLRWDPHDLPDPSPYTLLHVGSIGSWMRPGAQAVADLVARAHRLGVPVSLDPNVRPALAPDLVAVWSDVRRLAASCRIVKLSDEDAEALADRAGDADGAAEADGAGEPARDAVVDRLVAAGPALVALTRGDAGAVLVSGSTRTETTAPGVAVADTIGAGDSWMAGLLAGLATREWTALPTYTADQLGWLGSLAGTAAAVTCSRPGADPPWRRELPELDAAQ